MTADKIPDRSAPASANQPPTSERDIAGAAFKVTCVMRKNAIAGKISPLDFLAGSRAAVDKAISIISGSPESWHGQPVFDYARNELATQFYAEFLKVCDHAKRGGESEQSCSESVAIALLRVVAQLIAPVDAPTKADRDRIAAEGGSLAAIADARWSAVDRAAKMYVPNGSSFRLSFSNRGYWELISCPRKPAIAKADVNQFLAELCEFVVVSLMREHHKPAD